MSILTTLVVISLNTLYVAAFNIPIPQMSHIDYTKITPYWNSPPQQVKPQVFHPKCYNYISNQWSSCPTANQFNHINSAISNEGLTNMYRGYSGQLPRTYNQYVNGETLNTASIEKPIQNNRRMMFLPQIMNPLKLLPLPISIPSNLFSSQYSEIPVSDNNLNLNNFNRPLDNMVDYYNYYPESLSREHSVTAMSVKQTDAPNISPVAPKKTVKPPENIYDSFGRSLDQLERKFYATTFEKLLNISPTNRKENGISFVQSGLFLLLGLVALASEIDFETNQEIANCIKLQVTEYDKLSAITKEILASLPPSDNDLKFRWSTRLLLWPSYNVSEQFKTGPAAALRMHVDTFNGTETPSKIAEILNDMVETDSGGSIRNTFEEDDLSDGARAILLTTLYLRGRWRSAPTMLNGSRPFRDTAGAPTRSMRCIRVNDVMRYADLAEWNAEAIEIFYATPDLSLLMLVPRDNSLRRLADHVANTSTHYITQRMQTIRIAVTMPLYTLRMTLLLPNKLQAMGITTLVDTSKTANSLRLSHAVQRLMFWAEAGRNAFKDDGIEWEETPELEIVVDRPYIFFVRWRNLTLMNGNFVL